MDIIFNINKYSMRKISLYAIIDAFFTFSLLFILNLIWSLYFIKNIWTSLITSCLVSIATIFAINYINAKKNNIKKPKLQETKHIEDVKNTFIFLPNDELIDFFYKLAYKKHTAKKFDNYVEITNQSKVILFPIFKIAPITSDEIINIYNNINKSNVKKIIIVCNKYDDNAKYIIENFNCKTILLDYKQTYLELLKPYEFFPEITIKEKSQAKNNYRKLINIAFNKKRTKSYILSALFIVFASFFVRYKIYYLIVASLLIIFAFICQLENKFKFNTQSKDEILG